VDWTI